MRSCCLKVYLICSCRPPLFKQYCLCILISRINCDQSYATVTLHYFRHYFRRVSQSAVIACPASVWFLSLLHPFPSPFPSPSFTCCFPSRSQQAPWKFQRSQVRWAPKCWTGSTFKCSETCFIHCVQKSWIKRNNSQNVRIATCIDHTKNLEQHALLNVHQSLKLQHV